MPYKRKQNGKTTWIGQVQWQGIRKKRSFSTKREAAVWELKLLKRLKNPAPMNPTPTDSLLEWATWYLDYAKRFSSKVFSEKRNEFKRFFNHKKTDPASPVTSLTPGKALDYCQSQFRERGGKCVNGKVIKNMAAAYNHGIKYRGYPTPNPFLVIEKYPEEESRGHYVPSESDFWLAYAVAKGQDRVLLATFLHTAARRGEVYRLKWEDVDFERSQLALKTHKTKAGSLRTDWIPMTTELAQTLKRHQEQSDHEHVFTQKVGRHYGKPYTENRGFPQSLCKEAGVKPFGCHGIRGLTATLLAKEGIPMKTIQEILRHQKLATTERYLRQTGNAREALGHLEGRFRMLENFVPPSVPPKQKKPPEGWTSGGCN